MDAVRARLATVSRRPGALRALLAGNPLPPTPELEALMPGLRFGTPHGETYVVRHTRPLSAMHGHGAPLDLLGRDLSDLLLLCGRDPDDEAIPADPARWLFLDTEATGLSGWAGSLAFVIALGYLAPDGFRVDQYLVRSFEEEAAALHHAAELASRFDALVTFNGRSFDAPLLATRAAMNGVADPWSEMPQLDLLAPARRVFQERVPNCQLQTLERHILGVHRVDDLPSREVPAAWFDYVHRDDPCPLVGVLEHNLNDVLSLATLASALVDATHGAHLAKARAHVRLALDFEGRPRTLSRALASARRARDMLEQAGASDEERSRAERRIRRMTKKMAA